ncbi:hypothetical protein CDD83_4191 [Cordyceps sp. RAO-2017]|nr:hypothetical protein CDD83_4191 [Cordyceps sp. RAO-2017]
MATIALPRPIPSHSAASDIATSITPPYPLEEAGPSSTSSSTCPVPPPDNHVATSPASSFPTANHTPPSLTDGDEAKQSSLLYPPVAYARLDDGPLSIYEINADQVVQALDFAARQPLPPSSLVFPWLHGLHPSNQVQRTFFVGRQRITRRTPSCLRGISLVKANGDLSVGRLKGAIAPDEFLRRDSYPEFIDADPIDGFSVRNFQIQTAKAALTSDLIIYGDNQTEVRRTAWDVAAAQAQSREQHAARGNALPYYNTFVCTSTLKDFETHHGSIVCIDSSGNPTGKVLDLVHQERREMWDMTEASEISHNVFMGPTPEPRSPEEKRFDILIECCDLGQLNPAALELIALVDDPVIQSHLDFPSSGSILPPTWSHEEADGILETCRWMYSLSNAVPPVMLDAQAWDRDGEPPPKSERPALSDKTRPRKILIHCSDGYTESTLLGIAYLSYSTGRSVPDAWLDLHISKHRNFFAYPSDVALLTALQPRLLQESPLCATRSLLDITHIIKNEPKWFAGLDGSLPSRILDYLYLGNLGHANNLDLLKELGIKQILSVGETVAWKDGDLEDWGTGNVCVVQGVQDNGLDSLTDKFTRCLEFIDRGRREGVATLVHCRVGVSRSATICIAEVMRALNTSFPRAYCFVRARRLNVIIQPHLRFAYELLQWEQRLQRDASVLSPRRELEWGEIAREITLMNRPYSK